jgi:NADH-quinone oxidoreductase subunit C
VPDAARLEQVAGELRAELGEAALIEAGLAHGQAYLEIPPERVRDVLGFLKSAAGLEFHFLASVHGCDYLPQAPRLGVHYELLNMRRVERLRVKTRVDVDAAKVPSVTNLFATADFQEREVYDMFGVEFEGHPDMRRILLPEDYEGFPQRRDFPVGGEPVMFTHNEPEGPGWYE